MNFQFSVFVLRTRMYFSLFVPFSLNSFSIGTPTFGKCFHLNYKCFDRHITGSGVTGKNNPISSAVWCWLLGCVVQCHYIENAAAVLSLAVADSSDSSDIEIWKSLPNAGYNDEIELIHLQASWSHSIRRLTGRQPCLNTTFWFSSDPSVSRIFFFKFKIAIYFIKILYDFFFSLVLIDGAIYGIMYISRFFHSTNFHQFWHLCSTVHCLREKKNIFEFYCPNS